MNKILLVLVAFAIVGVAMAQNTTTDREKALAPTTTELDGASRDLQDLAINATLAVALRVRLVPNEAELAVIVAAVDAQLAAFLTQLQAAQSPAVTVADLRAYYQLAAGNISAAWTRYSAAKAELVRDLSSNLTVWRERAENLTKNRDLAVTDAESLVERLKAVYVYELVSIGTKALAVALARLRLGGQVTDLQFKLAYAYLIALNNTIAQKNGTALGIEWTVIANDKLVASIRGIAIAEQIAEWQVRQLDAAIPAIQLELQNAVQQLNQRVKNFVEGVYKRLQDLRAAWEANKEAIIARIKERVQDFLERVNKTEVTITFDANGNVSLSITITREDLVGEIRDRVKAAIREQVKILIAALAESRPDNVTVTVNEPSAKRDVLGQSLWTVGAVVGTQESTEPTETKEDSGAAIVASLGLIVAVLAALLL